MIMMIMIIIVVVTVAMVLVIYYCVSVEDTVFVQNQEKKVCLRNIVLL